MNQSTPDCRYIEIKSFKKKITMKTVLLYLYTTFKEDPINLLREGKLEEVNPISTAK